MENLVHLQIAQHLDEAMAKFEKTGVIGSLADAISKLSKQVRAFETEEVSRFTAMSNELVSLKEKVRIMDDEFSKRTKGMESVLQRREVDWDDKFKDVKQTLETTAKDLAEKWQHTER